MISTGTSKTGARTSVARWKVCSRTASIVPRPMGFDRWLFLTTALLVVAGLFLVGSASYYFAMSLGLHPYHFLILHSLHALVGAAAFTAALYLPYQKLASRPLVLGGMAASLVALALVWTMPAVGGAHRWYRFGPLTVQPSELAKPVAVVFTAYLLSRRESEVNVLRRVPMPCLLGVGPLVLLIVIEPDLGTALMLVLTVSVMVFVAGLRWKYIGASVGAGVLGLLLAVLIEPYRIQRIKTYVGSLFGPTEDTLGAGFQLVQSLIAVGSGGVTGAGWGQGQQKALYLPAAHTDFLFSVIGEELGLLGTGLMLAAFLLLFWRGIRTALRAPDRFGFYLALGITSLLVLQALIHMGVCLGLLPTKGLPLPLLSHGGSSLVATMAAVGVLLNVSQHSN